MKRILIALLFITALAATARAVHVGFDAGYLIDTEEEFLSARVGFEVARSNSLAHQLELEVGFTGSSEDDIDGDIVATMANYRLAADGYGKWGYYFGGGLGSARISIDGVSTGGPIRLRDDAFALQALAGATYHFNDSVELTLGARYIWIDEVTFVGTSFEVGDDVAVSLGLNFKF
jgi:opacity protein-like surface antigen